MKKLMLIALLAMMLISMLTFVACKTETDEAAADTMEVVDEAATTTTDSMAVVDSTVVAPQ